MIPLFCCILFRSKDYTEFKTCTKCNPVAKDNYDSLNTTTIGMYWCIWLFKHNFIFVKLSFYFEVGNLQYLINYSFKLLKSAKIYHIRFTRQIQQIVATYRNLSRKLFIFISAWRINVIYQSITSTRWSFAYHL